MPPKLILNTNHPDYVPPKKRYSKAKEWNQSEWTTNYLKDRDRVLWRLYPESRKEIEDRYK